MNRLEMLFLKHPDVDFIFGNSSQLDASYLDDYPSPFDIENLPEKMERFSKFNQEGEMTFFELIDPKVTFDFLGGVFLSIFRRKNWMENAHVLDQNALGDERTFSSFDNTFPHLKIYAHAFSSSKAYFNASPLCVCLSGAREWTPLASLVVSVRLVEALGQYRKCGMPFFRYIYCKNEAVRHWFPDFIKMFLHKKTSGYEYVKMWRLLLEYSLYPNFYLSFFYTLGRQMNQFWNVLVKR
jgi:hypothetical protein